MIISLVWKGPTFLHLSLSRSVRAPIVGPVFAALENKAILKGILSGGVFNPKTLPPDFIDELSRVGKRKGYSKVARAVYKSLPSYVAARAIYKDVTVPVTMVYGDHDWSRRQERESALAEIRGAKMITLSNTGHLSSLESPD
jgi:pimeloyl-ACP methyl ester carboxylesterase